MCKEWMQEAFESRIREVIWKVIARWQSVFCIAGIALHSILGFGPRSPVFKQHG